MSDRLTKTLGPRFAALAGSVRLGSRITFRVRGCESDSIREGEAVTITTRGVMAYDGHEQHFVKWARVVAVGAPND